MEQPKVDEMVYYVFWTIDGNINESHEANMVSTMSNDALGANNVTFNSLTNIGSDILKPEDHVVWRFPYEIQTNIRLKQASNT